MTETPAPTNTTPPATPLPSQPEPVRMSVAEALDKINVLEAQNKSQADSLKKVTEERDLANSVLDGQVRASYLSKLRGISTIPEAKLTQLPTNQLEALIKSSEVLRFSNPKSIQFGNDDQTRDDPLDLYSQRIKNNRR